ncbi:TniQ family protein [Myroides odoratimimus]|uniref:TniQ family protein n=1 Tax=Myroides odoratimimus TaxID=76832 RepID=UPI002574A42D|nr:TniQ family protein [Myroides odoratimimus]MDM1397766.1 TniQ family protein [Myroides odoratimimus]
MVFIKGKTIWPLYIPPQDDELFSSWVCRLAYEHQVKVYTFLKLYFSNEYNYLARNIDLLKPLELTKTLRTHTFLNDLEIDNLFLSSYEGIIFEINTYKTYTKGILPLGIFNQARRNYGTLYCPLCLNKDIPYFKKKWRLTSSIICVECNIRLKDRCDKCGNPITYHLNNRSINTSELIHPYSLKFCQCGHDLSTITTKDLTPTNKEIDYQLFINNTIDTGYNQITSYSFLFFDGFFLLVEKYLHDSKENRLRKSLIKKLNRTNIPSQKKNLGLWSLEERRSAILDVYTLFEDYPDTLNNFLTENNIHKSYVRNNNNYPYWLLKNFI